MRFSGTYGADFITRDLLAQEVIKRLSCVERVDDPVTVTPRVRPASIVLVAVAFGPSHYIQPVPRPSLTVGGIR